MDIANSITSNVQQQLPNAKDIQYTPLKGKAFFNGYNVSRAGDLPCRLTLFWDGGHSFVRLQNSARDVDMTKGFYPGRLLPTEQALGQCRAPEDDPQLAGLRPNAERQRQRSTVNSAAWVKVLGTGSATGGSSHILTTAPPAKILAASCGSSATQRQSIKWGAHITGMVEDEIKNYRQYGGTGAIPKVSFAISSQEAIEVEKFLVEYAQACDWEDPDCVYRMLGHNCIDFSQSVFEKTSYPGHFIGYFPSRMLLTSGSMGALYAASSHPEVSFFGSMALSAVMVFHVIPKATNWLKGIVWPEETVDTEALRGRYQYVQACFYDCERFWDELPGRNETTHRLISDSTDLQFRFLAIEKDIKKRLDAVQAQRPAAGHNEPEEVDEPDEVDQRLDPGHMRLPTPLHRELKEIEQGFRLFEQERQEMLAAHPELTVEQP